MKNIASSSSAAARLMARAPWLVAGSAAIAAVAALLAFNAWAARYAPALSLAHPLAAVPSLLLLVLALSVRVWPVRRPAASQPSPEWNAMAKQASHALRQHGFTVAEAGWQPGADQVLRRDGRTCVVHARHWRASTVDAAAVRALALDVAQRGASGGLLLCAGGSFTPRARQLAQLHGIVLLGRSGPVGGRPKAQGAPAAAEAPAPKPAPVLRPDHQVFVRPRFEPTVPMSDAERRRAVPQLRPDHEVAARREFAPTVPMTDGLCLH